MKELYFFSWKIFSILQQAYQLPVLQLYCEAALKPKMSDPGLEIAAIFHPILILIFQQSGCRRGATQSRRHICPAGGKRHSFTACSHIYQTCLQTHT